MKYLKLIIGTFILLMMTACGLSPFEEDNNLIKPEQTGLQEASTLFSPDEDNKRFTFETNDTKYTGVNGYTLWTVPNVNTEEKFIPISVKITKESGRTEAGFGLVFCEQNINDKPFLLTVMINSNGLFSIGKVYDGVFSHINNGWIKSEVIYRGLGISNTLTIDFDENSKSFLVGINGYEVSKFTVNENLVFKNSKSGFVVVIANNENFPSKPVKVSFENN